MRMFQFHQEMRVLDAKQQEHVYPPGVHELEDWVADNPYTKHHAVELGKDNKPITQIPPKLAGPHEAVRYEPILHSPAKVVVAPPADPIHKTPTEAPIRKTVETPMTTATHHAPKPVPLPKPKAFVKKPPSKPTPRGKR